MRPRRRLIEEISPAKQEASCAEQNQRTKSEIAPASCGGSRTHTRSNKSERLCVPDHSVSVKEPDSKHPMRRVLVKVTLPGVSSANQVDLEVSKVNKNKIPVIYTQVVHAYKDLLSAQSSGKEPHSYNMTWCMTPRHCACTIWEVKPLQYTYIIAEADHCQCVVCILIEDRVLPTRGFLGSVYIGPADHAC